MAKTLLKLEFKPSFRDALGRFAVADKSLFETRRNELRGSARRLVAIAQDEAPKRTGGFARDIRFRTFADAQQFGFTVSTPQPLGKWITEGTKPHTITPRGTGYPLRFEVGGKTVFAYKVNHPGTKPNNFMGRAYDRWKPEARETLNRIALRYKKTITGVS